MSERDKYPFSRVDTLFCLRKLTDNFFGDMIGKKFKKSSRKVQEALYAQKNHLYLDERFASLPERLRHAHRKSRRPNASAGGYADRRI
jgi:hypothetical protein